jgi:hypothetical protein
MENWYTSEEIVHEELRARRAKAQVARLAATAQRDRTRRLIGTVLIKLGRMLVAESRSPVPEGTTYEALDLGGHRWRFLQRMREAPRSEWC